ncbi:MAG: ATP-dependent 6-phosphofructokinase [Alphaproteobacteria bacterium]|nr:ATP-dependent 6-phosphofructokinase [Alphaproteobacteria bacterium]MCB9975453.1 ATP-dependent 6-phosphofructokinase [Rhodospirillales bacterium]
MKKKIAIFTSGGDCAGLNAVMRAVVLSASGLGWEVLGIENGTAGLLENPPECRTLTPEIFDTTIMRQGGTILGTTNSRNPFEYKMPDGSVRDRSDELIAAFRALEIDYIIGIGGDGSFRILNKLMNKGGLNFIGIPKTIDNDLNMTDYSVGFDTAVSVATEAMDRLQPTAASHDRVMVLEVMGRDAGHIALTAGIAGGADVILIPEIPYTVENIAKKINKVQVSGRNFALVMVSEAVKTPDGRKFEVVYHGGETRYGGIGEYLGVQIAQATNSETRVTILGHVQRGASPTFNDRLLASALGVKAVDLLRQGKFARMVAWHNMEVIDVPIDHAISECRTVSTDSVLVRTARALGISFGDT